jgi:hypothetical protein
MTLHLPFIGFERRIPAAAYHRSPDRPGWLFLGGLRSAWPGLYFTSRCTSCRQGIHYTMQFQRTAKSVSTIFLTPVDHPNIEPSGFARVLSCAIVADAGDGSLAQTPMGKFSNMTAFFTSEWFSQRLHLWVTKPA